VQNRNEIGRRGDSPRRTGVENINACANPFHKPSFHDFYQPVKKGINEAQPRPEDDSARIVVILYKVSD
jgi:hypothetical protein